MSYISVLGATERSVLLEYLSKYLTDSELVALVSNIQSERERTKSDARAAAKRMGPNVATALDEHKEAASKTLTPADEAPAPVSKVVKLVEPPGEAAARITEASVKAILERLKKPEATLEAINKELKGKMDNTQRLLKLMWVRKQIVFNGSEYFIA